MEQKKYGTINTEIWHNDRFRRLSMDASLLYINLITSSSSNVLGMYKYPIYMIAAETRINEENVGAALSELSSKNLAHYCDKTKYVYIPNMLRCQLGKRSQKDGYLKMVKNTFLELKNNKFLLDFFVYNLEYFPEADLEVVEMHMENQLKKGESKNIEYKIYPPLTPPLGGSEGSLSLSLSLSSCYIKDYITKSIYNYNNIIIKKEFKDKKTDDLQVLQKKSTKTISCGPGSHLIPKPELDNCEITHDNIATIDLGTEPMPRHGYDQQNATAANVGRLMTIPGLGSGTHIATATDVPKKEKLDVSISKKINQIYEHWNECATSAKKCGVKIGPRKKDQKRTAKIAARLNDGYSVTELCNAIDWYFNDSWHRGENNNGKTYLDLDLICRDQKHVDEALDHYNARPNQSRLNANDINGVPLDPLARESYLELFGGRDGTT